MSADNTILVVKRDGLFRVAHVVSASNITEHHDESTFSYWFNNSKPIKSLKRALKKAQELEDEFLKEGFPVEYGITVFHWPNEGHTQ